MESCCEESCYGTSGLVDEEEGDRCVKDGCEPVNNQKISHIAAHEEAKGREDPVKAKIGHRVLPLVKPFGRQLLQAGDKVQYEKLEFQ